MSSGGGLAGHNEPLTVDGIQANTVHAIHYTSIQAPWHMGVCTHSILYRHTTQVLLAWHTSTMTMTYRHTECSEFGYTGNCYS